MPEVFSRNTRHERWHNSTHLSLLCIATHMLFAHTSDKNRYRIFLMPFLSERVFTLGHIVGPGFGFYKKCQGIGIGLIEILQQL